VTRFAEVAPLALMSGSIELLQAWVIETLGTLADDDEQGARLRDTLNHLNRPVPDSLAR
jgi:hypothetical protein